MAIERAENPATGEEIVVVKGRVDQISFKAIELDRFQNTHKAGIRIGDDWVNNISLKVKEGYDPQVRFNNGNNAKPDWVTLEVGDEVRIVVTENEWNDKIYYNSGTSKIKLVKKGEGGAAKAPTGGSKTASTGFKRDNSGVSTGHGINVAINVLGSLEDPQAIIEAAKEAHTLTVKLKNEYAEKNPEMSEYDVGAMVGQSILSSSHYAESVSDIEDLARQTLDTIVPAVSAFVKGESADPAPAKKPAAKKAPTKKAAPKKEVVEEDVSNDAPWDDDEDSIPF